MFEKNFKKKSERRVQFKTQFFKTVFNIILIFRTTRTFVSEERDLIHRLCGWEDWKVRKYRKYTCPFYYVAKLSRHFEIEISLS